MRPTKFNHLVKNNSFLKSIVDLGAELITLALFVTIILKLKI